MSRKFAVVGAGVVGLTTAVQLQQMYPSASVTIIADKFMKETTSIGAAGIFHPRPMAISNPSFDINDLWFYSWAYFHALAHSEDSAEAGCHIICGYEYYDTKEDVDFRRKNMYAFDEIASETEMNMFPGPQFKFGYRATSILTSPVRYLPYLTKLISSNGGQFVKRKLNTLEELVGSYDIVVNCTGLGARELVGDSKMYSSRGQIIKVVAPWIKTYLYAEDKEGNATYVYPVTDFVVVGGIRQSNDECLQPRDADRDAIWQRATQIVPSLKRAHIIGDWVGLRPKRDSLRLEAEVLNYSTGSLKVVHNYGHGSEGIGLSWGTAKKAVSLVRGMLNENKLMSKM